MNRREFIRRGIYLAGAFACLPSGVGLAEETGEALTVADIMRMRAMLEEQAIHEPYYLFVRPDEIERARDEFATCGVTCLEMPGLGV